MANKRKKKKLVNRNKSFASALELVRFRQNVAKANKRIQRLENAGLEPRALSEIKGFLGYENRFRIPRNLTELEYKNISIVVNKFLSLKESTTKVAKLGEQKRRENFHESLKKAFRGKTVSSDVEQRLYGIIGDLDIDKLTDNYAYEEVLNAAKKLDNAGIRVTDDLVSDVLNRNIKVVVKDFLIERGVLQGYDVPVDKLPSMEHYVKIAIQDGVQEAVNEYMDDLREVL